MVPVVFFGCMGRVSMADSKATAETFASFSDWLPAGSGKTILW